jgi:hypothetical protein
MELTYGGGLSVQSTPRLLRDLRLVVQVLGNIERRDDVIVAELGLLPCSQQPRNLQDVLNLSPIHTHTRKLIQLLLGDAMFLWRRVEEVLPHRAPRVDGKLFVVERDVNTRLEGLIERLYTVRREEHGT